VTTPRAADDFEVIRERLEELRREREEISSTNTPATDGENGGDGDEEAEKRRQESCEGAPPAWVPTIFLPQPTD
jgi:hypothetical protein